MNTLNKIKFFYSRNVAHLPPGDPYHEDAWSVDVRRIYGLSYHPSPMKTEVGWWIVWIDTGTGVEGHVLDPNEHFKASDDSKERHGGVRGLRDGVILWDWLENCGSSIAIHRTISFQDKAIELGPTGKSKASFGPKLPHVPIHSTEKVIFMLLGSDARKLCSPHPFLGRGFVGRVECIEEDRFRQNCTNYPDGVWIVMARTPMGAGVVHCYLHPTTAAKIHESLDPIHRRPGCSTKHTYELNGEATDKVLHYLHNITEPRLDVIWFDDAAQRLENCKRGGGGGGGITRGRPNLPNIN